MKDDRPPRKRGDLHDWQAMDRDFYNDFCSSISDPTNKILAGHAEDVEAQLRRMYVYGWTASYGAEFGYNDVAAVGPALYFRPETK